MEYCTQCGQDTEEFKEGVCVECCDQNQLELDRHNAQHDAWLKMSEGEKVTAIKAAYKD